MESSKLKWLGALRTVAFVVILAAGVLTVHNVSRGIARHGGIGAYWESRQKSDTLLEAVDIINSFYVDGEAAGMDELTESALNGILSDLDPYSEYLSPERLQNLREQTSQEFGGIGIQVEMKDRRLTIVAPIEGTPGAKAGLLRGDQITAVDGESIDNKPMNESVEQLRGAPGSKVLLTVFRPRSKEEFETSIIRELIDVDNVRSAEMLEDGIGYLRILQFGGRTGDEMIEAIEELIDQGMSRLIIDLRGNPGGLLDVAVEVASPFLKTGQLVVYTEGRRVRENDRWEVKPGSPRYDFPLVILVDGGSASASEIVAGAIKDLKRGTLVGEKTFGKGSVQTIIKLGEDSGLRLTTAKYYTPGGYVIQGNGIEPDLLVELEAEEIRKLAIQRNRLDLMSPEEFSEEFEFEPIADRQLEAALEILRSE